MPRMSLSATPSEVPARGRRGRRAGRLFLRFLLAILVADALYLAWVQPDWQALAAGPIPKSAYIRAFEQESSGDPDAPPLDWRPVPFSAISGHLRRAVVVAEDAHFWRHKGFDLGAIREAIEYDLARGRLAYGASTLSQQTARNLFLSPSRNPLRKWHELVLTFLMERNLPKERILELYLDSAEFGPGIYGAEAAAQRYFGVSAAGLSRSQAIMLAACLPSPKLHNPDTDTPEFRRRAEKITRHMNMARP